MEWSYEVAITQLHPRSSFFRSSYANSTYKSIESISFDIALAIDTLELEARAMLIVKLSNRRVLLLWWYAHVPREVHRPGSRAMLEGAAHSLFSPSSPSSPFSHARFSARKQEKERGAEGDKSDEGQRGHGPTPDASVPPLMSPPVILTARARVYRCCRRERGIPSVTPPAKDRPVCGPRAPPGSASVAALRTPQASFAHRKA